MSTELKDKVYIVTGGSKGFGLAIAKSLVARGARVGLLSRNQSGLDQAVSEIGSDHAYGVASDVAHREDISAAFESIKQHFGRLDGLVNNAGMARPNAVENLVEAEVLMQVQTNFLGTVFCCQAAIPLLRGGENPRIINISSASAHHYDEMSHLSIYASTKAAVERFTRDLRVELQDDNIGVTCLRPGAAWTSFAEGWDAGAIQAGMEAWAHAGTYMDTGMEVEQVGDAVAYSLSQPVGVAVDLLEIRPNVLTPKAQF
ncbi:MAG: SDR family NAD(P)-dependent oxidoreductase [Haliea sp.]|jgi:NAD(P)-dependent dehydrogenase (short-subunit alcohol dehydrogenase family)|nr:SDR family NAD(P)-dependent oxidoreductase [Haliea sp.]